MANAQHPQDSGEQAPRAAAVAEPGRPAGEPLKSDATALARVETASPAAPVVAPAAAAKVIEGVQFTPAQVQLVKDTIAQNATDDELELFLYTCQRLRLDPFGRQIYFMKRRNNSSEDSGDSTGRAQVSIDGLRLVAERTGEYQGQTPPEWARVTMDGGSPVIEWFPVWPFTTPPQSARIGVYRRGFREPMFAVARFEAYKVTKSGGALNRMWQKMGPEQLAKCAEALALRKAFPQELSGVYTVDEMEQADNDDDDRPSRAPRQQGARRDTASARRAPAITRRVPDRAATGFPFDPRRGVPLDAKYPADHEHAGTYQVSDDLIGRAVQWTGGVIETGKIKQGKYPKDHELAGQELPPKLLDDEARKRFQILHDALIEELEERREEASAVAAVAAETPTDAPPLDDAPPVEREPTDDIGGAFDRG